MVWLGTGNKIDGIPSQSQSQTLEKLLFPYNLYSTYRSQLSEIFHSKVFFREGRKLLRTEKGGGIEKVGTSDDKNFVHYFQFSRWL